MPATVSFFESYLPSLRRAVATTTPLKERVKQTVTDRVLDSLCKDGALDAKAVSRMIPNLKGNQASDIAKTVSSFVRTFGLRMDDSTLILPEQVIKTGFSEDGLAYIPELEKEIHSASRQLSFNRIGADFRKLVTIAKKINPEFKTALNEGELINGSIETWKSLMEEIDMQILIPANQVFDINLEGGREPDAFHARIKRDTWKQERFPYLGNNFWTAEIKKLMGEKIGSTHGYFAFYDPEASRKDSESTYDLIRLRPQNEFFHRLRDFITHLNLSKDDYCRLFGEYRSKYEQVGHAQNQIFITEWKKLKSLDLPPNKLRLECLLKDDNPYRGLVSEFTDDNEKGLATLAYSASVTAGELSGIITEMNIHIEEGRHDLAYCAFLDFLGVQKMRYDMFDLDDDGLNSAYKISSGLILNSFKDLYDHNSPAETIRDCEATAKPAFTALNYLREVKDLNFRNEVEIERLKSQS